MKIAFYISRYPEEIFTQQPPSVQYLAGHLIGEKLISKEDILFANSSNEILNFNPDVLAIGSVSQSFDDAISKATEIKNLILSCWTIIGGYHISALPETLPKVFDIGIIGEGEIILEKVISLKIKSSNIDKEELKLINGICFHNNNRQITITNKCELVEDINSMHLPYRKLEYASEWAYLFTARGCPYECIYCASQVFWDKYRYYSAEYVVNEIDRLVNNHGVTSIYFVDDLFIAPKKRLLKIKELIEKKEWFGNVYFKGFIRVNLIDEETIQILKYIGFIEIRFGMETASERLLKKIKDKPFTIQQAENTILLSNKYNLPICASFMFGIPDETYEDIEQTKKFLRRYYEKFNISGCYIMQPIPGTKLWDNCISEGITSTDINFSFLELDLTRENFNWDKVKYFNSKNIPIKKFKNIIEDIKNEFITKKSKNLLRKIESLRIIKNGCKKIINLTLDKTYVQLTKIKLFYRNFRTTKGKKIKNVKIYVGCGHDKKEGYIGCDIRKLLTVKIICNAWEISNFFANAEEIFSRHMIEHLTLPEVEATLNDWLKALSPGGKIRIIVPNMNLHVQQWKRAKWNKDAWKKKNSDARHSFAGFWGWQRECRINDLQRNKDINYWDVHKCGFNKDFMSFLLSKNNFVNIDCKVVDDVHLVCTAFKENN